MTGENFSSSVDYAQFLRAKAVSGRTREGTVTLEPKYVNGNGVIFSRTYNFCGGVYSDDGGHYDSQKEYDADILNDTQRNIETMVTGSFDVSYIGSDSDNVHKFEISTSGKFELELRKFHNRKSK